MKVKSVRVDKAHYVYSALVMVINPSRSNQYNKVARDDHTGYFKLALIR